MSSGPRLILYALSMMTLSSCVLPPKGPLYSRTTARFEPRPAGCDFKVLDDLVLDGFKYESLGTVPVDFEKAGKVDDLVPKVRQTVQKYVCAWGGTAVHTGPLVHLQSDDVALVSSSVDVTIVREMQPGEYSSLAKHLGIGDDALRKQASFDHNCSLDQVRVVARYENQGSGNYHVEVCGQLMRYRRGGTVYEYVPGEVPAANQPTPNAPPPTTGI